MAKRAASSKPKRPARKTPGAANSRRGRSGTNDRPKRSQFPPKGEPNHLETVGEFVSRKAWDEKGFGGVLAYLAGIMDQPEILLRELSGGENAKGKPTPLNKFGDDVLRHRLRSAALCLNEMSIRKRERHEVVAWTERVSVEVIFVRIRIRVEGWDYELGQPALNAIVRAQFRRRGTVLESLRAALRTDKDEYVRCHAVRALINAGAHAPLAEWNQILVDVRAVLREDEDEVVRRTAAEALGKAAAHAPLAERTHVLTDLRAALREDKDQDVRRTVAETLGNAVSHASPQELSQILADLRATLHSDEAWWVRAYATKFLGKAAAHTSPQELSEILADLRTALREDESDWVRGGAATAFGKAATYVSPAERSQILSDLRSCSHEAEREFVPDAEAWTWYGPNTRRLRIQPPMWVELWKDLARGDVAPPRRGLM